MTVAQSCPPTPGEPGKRPLHIPLAVGLLDGAGNDMTLRLAGEDAAAASTTRVLEVREAKQRFTFVDVAEAPTPSLLRGFSAPAILDPAPPRDRLAFLMAHDSDPFNRWEAGQQFALAWLLDAIAAIRDGAAPQPPDAFVAALGAAIADDSIPDKAFRAQMLTLPGEEYIGNQMAVVDVEAIHAARETLRRAIAERLRETLEALYHGNAGNRPYSPDAAEAGRRRLRNAALGYLALLDDAGAPLPATQYRQADNMTDRIAALDILSDMDVPARREALADFHQRWKDDPIVMDKWLAIQATSSLPGTLDAVVRLLDHEVFSIRNPNRVRALIGAFCNANPLRFHAADGAGYAFLADQVLRLDPINPQVAARLLAPLGPWRHFEKPRRDHMKAQLERILAAGDSLSRDVYEIASKSLRE